MTTRLLVTAQHRRLLWIIFGLTFIYFLVAVVGGLLTNSLALLADAALMLIDVGGLGLALFAAWMSSKSATRATTNGYYRAEILAALAGAIALFMMSFYILYEAYRRLQEPPEVNSLPMPAIALVGLIVKLIGMRLLRPAFKRSFNMPRALLDAASDLLGSVGVMVAGTTMWLTHWWYADPIVSVVIGLLILPRTWILLTQAVDVLLEATSPDINLLEVEEVILDIPAVSAVHDLRFRATTSGITSLSGHVVVANGTAPEIGSTVVDRVTEALKDRFEVDRLTFQVEGITKEESEADF